jgi:putative polyhydroxyalkanoate system protein
LDRAADRVEKARIGKRGDGGAELTEKLMATIDISRSHTLGTEVAKERAEDLAKSMATKLGIQWSWEGNHIKFNAPSGAAKGSTGTVSVDDKTVRVQVDLPFLLRAVKGTIEAKITEKINVLIGSA